MNILFLSGSPPPLSNGEGLILGQTNTGNYILYINNYQYKYDVQGEMNVIFHEIGHVNYIQQLKRDKLPKQIYDEFINNIPYIDQEFDNNKELITISLGEYATTSHIEFMACYFAEMMQGKDLNNDLTKLYLKYGGKLIRKE